MPIGPHDREIVDAFTRQADSFNAATVANAEDLLDEIVACCAPTADQAWLEAACGPGILTRRLAPHVGTVEGIDLTAAMIDLARSEAAGAQYRGVSFAIGDVTALDRPDAHYDGAVTRFSVHHLPVPGRMFGELARVVRPGGRIVVADHVADAGSDAAIWSQQIERLRDPSHWTCRTVDGLRTLGEQAGLRLVDEHAHPLRLDFEDWLDRGGVDEDGRARVEAALAEAPGHAPSFSVGGPPGRRTLTLRIWIGVWERRPGARPGGE